MKKAIGIPLLALLLAMALSVTAQAEETNRLNIAPGDCWTVTNTGETDIPLPGLKGLDYVITDADGIVKFRDVRGEIPSPTPTLSSGGQAILQDWGNGSSSGLELNGTVTAVKEDAPLLLHEELLFGEACQFTNTTDHTANVLVRGDSNGSVPSAWVIFDRDGTVAQTELPRGSSGNNAKVLSVPAGGRAVITPNSNSLYGSNTGIRSTSILTYCMARSKNFTLQRNVPSAWTFGGVGYNQPVSFRNVTEQTQTVQMDDCLYALYNAENDLVAVSSKVSKIDVPAGCAVALGSASLNGGRYAFLTDTFQPADLPGPVAQFSSASLAVTFRNVSGKAAPLYGVTQGMKERRPETYDITGVVSDTEDRKGVILPAGASVTVTGAEADIITLQDQFSVKVTRILETEKAAVALTEGAFCNLTNPGSEPVTVMLRGKGISVYGDGKDILSAYYQGYNRYSTRSDLTISAGGSVTFQAVMGPCCLTYDVGALTNRSGTAPIYASRVLHAGEGLRSSAALTAYGHPFHSVVLSQGDAQQYSYQALGTTIFSGRPWTMEDLDAPLIQSLTLNRGESCLVTRPSDETPYKSFPLQGVLLEASDQNGRWYNSYDIQPRAGKTYSLSSSEPTCSLTAVTDDCTVWYYPTLANVRAGAESAYVTETIPQGESRVYRAKDDYPNPLVFAYGFNAERCFFNQHQNAWDAAQRVQSNAAWGSTSWPTVKVAATDSDVTVVFLRGQVETGPVLALDRTLLSGGSPVSPADVGKTPVDTVSLTLLSERTEPFILILAAYDGAGRQIAAVRHPVAAGEAGPDHAASLSIPFPCGTETAKIRLMVVDQQLRPLEEAITLAG